MPVMAALPVAYFVNGDTGLKQTTEASWGNKFLNAEEIASIAPVPEAVLDDSAFNIWSEVQPFIVEAVGRTLDAAVFFGTNKPTTWPTAIVPAAVAAGNVATTGTATAAQGGVLGDISSAFGTVEGDGFDVNGIVASRKWKAALRNARSTTGEQLATIEGSGTDAEASPSSVFGVPVNYPLRGLWPSGAGAAEMIVGDFTEGILGVRQDITWKLLDQAGITDAEGKVVYNLAQQDMVAMRVVCRFAFEVANTPQPEAVSGAFPFGVLKGA
jgi:HK97 family phage major capsid protein